MHGHIATLTAAGARKYPALAQPFSATILETFVILVSEPWLETKIAGMQKDSITKVRVAMVSIVGDALNAQDDFICFVLNSHVLLEKISASIHEAQELR